MLLWLAQFSTSCWYLQFLLVRRSVWILKLMFMAELVWVWGEVRTVFVLVFTNKTNPSSKCSSWIRWLVACSAVWLFPIHLPIRSFWLLDQPLGSFLKVVTDTAHNFLNNSLFVVCTWISLCKYKCEMHCRGILNFNCDAFNPTLCALITEALLLCLLVSFMSFGYLQPFIYPPAGFVLSTNIFNPFFSTLFLWIKKIKHTMKWRMCDWSWYFCKIVLILAVAMLW